MLSPEGARFPRVSRPFGAGPTKANGGTYNFVSPALRAWGFETSSRLISAFERRMAVGWRGAPRCADASESAGLERTRCPFPALAITNEPDSMLRIEKQPGDKAKAG